MEIGKNYSRDLCRWVSYRYCLGPYRKRCGHVKGSAGAQRKGVAAVVSIRCDEGSLSGLAEAAMHFDSTAAVRGAVGGDIGRQHVGIEVGSRV